MAIFLSIFFVAMWVPNFVIIGLWDRLAGMWFIFPLNVPIVMMDLPEDLRFIVGSYITLAIFYTGEYLSLRLSILQQIGPS